MMTTKYDQCMGTGNLSDDGRALIESAAVAALGIIEKNVSSKGLAASIDNYPQVWTRDTVITFLGGAISRQEHLLNAFRVSLEILATRQDRFGQIPYLVRIKDEATAFRSADSNPWFVIGAVFYARQSGDQAWLKAQAPALVRALDWCESRDFKKNGLMESGECDDWADCLSNRGNVLFPNVLYRRALQLASEELFPLLPEEAARFAERAKYVEQAIQSTFWIQPHGTFEDATHVKVRTHMSVSLRRRPFFLPWVNLFEYGERFDTTGNLMAILTGVATPAQSDAILDYIHQAGLDRPFPVRVLYPSIREGESDWRNYYKVFGLNLPDQYHNGGIWPWVGGLYVAALAKCGRPDVARENLGTLAEALRTGKEKWECNEWLHGLSGVPMGAKFQAWSAGMFLYAKHAVETGEIPGF
jgi:glycogen debranching enzyme